VSILEPHFVNESIVEKGFACPARAVDKEKMGEAAVAVTTAASVAVTTAASVAESVAAHVVAVVATAAAAAATVMTVVKHFAFATAVATTIKSFFRKLLVTVAGVSWWGAVVLSDCGHDPAKSKALVFIERLDPFIDCIFCKWRCLKNYWKDLKWVQFLKLQQ
jgi:hypothetical protein